MQNNVGQQSPPGLLCGVARGYAQGPHVVYSLASDVKSFHINFVVATG